MCIALNVLLIVFRCFVFVTVKLLMSQTYHKKSSYFDYSTTHTRAYANYERETARNAAFSLKKCTKERNMSSRSPKTQVSPAATKLNYSVGSRYAMSASASNRSTTSVPRYSQSDIDVSDRVFQVPKVHNTINLLL